MFDDELQLRIQQRQELARELEVGIARGEVSAYFQPQHDLRTDELVGFEALARWHHPERGLVGPDEFIPVAEESNLIDAVGRAVLADACRALSTWRVLLGERTPIVSVNVSVDQLHDPGFADHVGQLVDDSGLPPDALCLEITESSLADPDRAAAALAALKETGVQIAIDDFGTGYSSFSRLHQFPVDFLKIDRALVDAMASETGLTLVSVVLGLSRALGFRCIAEGVETTEQREVLGGMGWDIGQGFLWSPAVPLGRANDMVAARASALGPQVRGARPGVG